MSEVPAYGYALCSVGQPLHRRELRGFDLGAEDVLVQVAGCGVCHTDVSFAVEGVPTRHPLPLVLGHEICGRVVDAGAAAGAWIGRDVLVPAVIPCGNCAPCRAGRPTACRSQFMPGNDGDGGFATHVRVPARGLCPVPGPLPDGLSLADLAVVADAVTTPYEAARRARLGADDVAVFVGAGGVGGFGVQIAAALGAAVVAIDIDPTKLERAASHGASLCLDARASTTQELRAAVRAFAKRSGKAGIGLKIFETSGTRAGQQTAFALLDARGYLGVVGYTPDSVEIRLSKLMALDATARGNWGCPPAEYPAALALVLSGKVAVKPYIEWHGLDEAPEVLAAVASRALTRRPVLVPAGPLDPSGGMP
jgi:6-hydroxycyclohex-1-ene-1-carbonyl-CoA dehydrogenase